MSASEAILKELHAELATQLLDIVRNGVPLFDKEGTEAGTRKATAAARVPPATLSAQMTSIALLHVQHGNHRPLGGTVKVCNYAKLDPLTGAHTFTSRQQHCIQP